MKSKKQHNKKILIIICLLSILLVICVGILIYYSFINTTISPQKQLEYINGEEWQDELYPDGMPALFRNYSGSLTCQNIGKSFDYVVNIIIPQYAKILTNFNQTQIEEYFETNKEMIRCDIGITNKEDFYNLIKKVQISVKSDNIEFEKFYIPLDSITKHSNITKAELHVKYKYCDELVLNIRINGTKISNLSSIQYK